MTIRESIEKSIHGSFVTGLYKYLQSGKMADFMYAYMKADLSNQRKMKMATPGGDLDVLLQQYLKNPVGAPFFVEGYTLPTEAQLAEQFEWVARLDDPTADPYNL